MPPFGATWGALRDRCEELPENATLITPLTNTRFRITDVQQSRIIIEDTDIGDSQPLQREQFEALSDHASDTTEGFPLEVCPVGRLTFSAVVSQTPLLASPVSVRSITYGEPAE